MLRLGLKLESWSWRRRLALLGCIALLYFASGGALLHQHSGPPDTACSVCHSVHVPVLAAAVLELFPQEQQVTWHPCIPQSPTPLDAFSLHRPSRAPPSL